MDKQLRMRVEGLNNMTTIQAEELAQDWNTSCNYLRGLKLKFMDGSWMLRCFSVRCFKKNHRVRQSSASLQEEIKEFTDAVSKAFKSAGYGVEAVDNSVDAKNYAARKKLLVESMQK